MHPGALGRTLPNQLLPTQLCRCYTTLPVTCLPHATPRYENFLMAEGERIWYWRNRTENERWFWEIFVWDRLIFRECGCRGMWGYGLGLV